MRAEYPNQLDYSGSDIGVEHLFGVLTQTQQAIVAGARPEAPNIASVAEAMGAVAGLALRRGLPREAVGPLLLAAAPLHVLVAGR